MIINKREQREFDDRFFEFLKRIVIGLRSYKKTQNTVSLDNSNPV